MNGIAIIEFHFFHKGTLRFSGCKFVYDSPSVTQVSSILFKRIVKINFFSKVNFTICRITDFLNLHQLSTFPERIAFNLRMSLSCKRFFNWGVIHGELLERTRLDFSIVGQMFYLFFASITKKSIICYAMFSFAVSVRRWNYNHRGECIQVYKSSIGLKLTYCTSISATCAEVILDVKSINWLIFFWHDFWAPMN